MFNFVSASLFSPLLSLGPVIIPGNNDRITIPDRLHACVPLKRCLGEKVDPVWIKEVLSSVGPRLSIGMRRTRQLRLRG